MNVLFANLQDHHVWCLHLPCFEINFKEHGIHKFTSELQLFDQDGPFAYSPPDI